MEKTLLQIIPGKQARKRTDTLCTINLQLAPHKVEVGCLKHPGASTIGSQETAFMACKPWQPSHVPHTEGSKTGSCHTDKKKKEFEREGGTGEGKQPLRRVSTQC